MRRTRLLLSVLALLFSRSFAHAATDGFYCSDIGYIAYDLGVGNEHELRIVTYGGRIGVGDPIRIPLTAFQTKAMKCDGAIVHLASDNAIWTFSIGAAGGTESLAKMKKITPGKVPEGFVTTNLGAGAKKGKTRLTALDKEHVYELEILSDKKKGDGMVETHIVSSLVQRSGATEDRRVILYENKFSEVEQ